MSRSQATGSAGELVAQACLLLRGWVAGNVNSGGMMNAPAVDIVAMKNKRNIRIAVKASGSSGNSVQWSAAPGWKSLFKGSERPDFVIFVWFFDKENIDARRIFVVPASVVDRQVLAAHNFWHSHMKKDGQPRKLGSHVAIWWGGNDSEKSRSRNFAHKWQRYEDAWDLLDGPTE
jgi:hypothetical protein